ncbi:hypothetical protein [Xanthomonas arboricola]|uniref:Uncharacterized protein n=6 Tax=Xanthomonas arboricola TaxID=56448 RepID=A0AAP4NIC2_9XANT|nr:hypothetical protein [Xanthomonas arboricola]GAE51643.1 hypothetical protein XPU_3175 [Xanthomonas arboricola pv. pruni str. MAFF 311562]GAE54137.1 hypothetical protein XPR_0772 [Xanthomonas arboricola pv. pruni MAFF 301420]GAE60950.1 hypothetical protein XPN_2856 [Xanthomonas arboricola pv. pruni MAFF 301427]KCW98469.1 hypothetical protein DK27_08720 [Xanthomonas arboricola pv. pruni]KOB01457.1 hypothetical protein AE920_05780 [Xanthomonas arboricola]
MRLLCILIASLVLLPLLAQATLQVIAEASDPPGRWQVQVTVNDRRRGVSIPLTGAFTLGRQRTRVPAQ